MAHNLTRSFACLRVSAATPSTLTRSAPFFQQIAFVSYRPNPLAPRRPHQPPPVKIHPSERPLAREPLEPPTITEEELASRPYVVRRTPYAQLPVYRVWKSGGTREIILVKKVNGNKQQLVKELKEKIGVAQDKIKINPTTGHIEINGHYLDKTRAHLIERGF
ncbi:unnamed protein product [Clonostachys solani]|uniref:Large ribosomal subunit protein mL49 n=1 Tax=Clonostachys solani TaxID=160281 RepID=A0A9N9YV29_9HYPO|nr:unnamed protein product [Clonostachys solani]